MNVKSFYSIKIFFESSYWDLICGIFILADFIPIGYRLSCCGSLWSRQGLFYFNPSLDIVAGQFNQVDQDILIELANLILPSMLKI